MAKKNPLDELPSREIYRKLIGNKEQHGDAACDPEVKNVLKQYVKNTDLENKIMGALCSVCKTESGTKTKKDYCNALYYWVGEELWKILSKEYGNEEQGKQRFFKAIGEYQDKVNKDNGKHGCSLAEPSDDPDIFKKLKELFDYTVDSEFICKAMNGEGTPCHEECQAYMQKVKDAYTTVHAKCKGDTDESWCVDFREWYREYLKTETLELKCPPKTKPNPNPNQAGSSGSFSDADLKDDVSGGEGKGGSDGGGSHRKEGEKTDVGGGAVAPAAVSGALATIGLPTLVYIFYKYKPFFLRKHNHSGVRRNKRSTFRHELNTLSEDDDYSTEVNSTINSTLESSEYSVPYTVPSR
ncbi:KIR protein [Plasmodium coatneyi]|uniref:KIR protein n=1 Tax=Plasmodium coatneyi TaxID=208452 RepID=A0A1B1E4P3_9APIC|nr:KIR protein [Plasmodium coatneyi]ANQ09900.1 KIR protein [Plasmodium coatneyi]